MMLCRNCLAIPSSFFSSHKCEPHILQPSFTALLAAADTGCKFCELLAWELTSQTAHPELWGHRSMLPRNPVGDVVLTSREAEDATCRISFRFSKICVDAVRLFGVHGQGLTINVIDCVWSRHPAGDTPLFYEPSPFKKSHFAPSYRRPELRRTLQRASDTVSNLDLIDKWIRNCIKNHDYCKHSRIQSYPDGNRRTLYTPTRLIDIGELTDTCNIRLVLCNSQEPQYRYTALSHCWGVADASVKAVISTTSKNFASRLEGFALENMPQTYQEAISVTRRLGERYIWIDSLCIIQDSTTDWENESAVMDKVYSFAYLTIVAAKAHNPNEGLFQNRDGIPTEVPIEGYMDGQGQGGITLHPILPITRDLINSGPLATRGWALQERQLSRRLVHFTTHQLLWECSSSSASEIYPEGGFDTLHPDFIFMSPQESGPSQIRALRGDFFPGEIMTDRTYYWSRIVEDFSKRKFTFSEDRLSALSGMNAAISPELQPYLAGLWKASLLSTLCWKVTQTSIPPPTRPEQYRAPSWSWASVEGAVTFSGSFDPVSGQGPGTLEILDAAVTSSSTINLMGNVSNGFLRVCGFLKVGIYTKQQNQSKLREQDKSDIGSILDREQDKSDIGSILDIETRQIQGLIHCDIEAEIKPEQIICCLHVYECEGLFDDLIYAGLALLPTGINKDEYHRVGITELPGEFWSIEAGLTKETITII